MQSKYGTPKHEVVPEATMAALRVLDHHYGIAKSSDPHGDKLAYAIDKLINDALEDADKETN